MKFNHSYYHSMDQGYYIPSGEGSSEDLDTSPKEFLSETSLGPNEIGFGSNPFQRPIQGISARIKQGVGYIDIPFFGSGKGNKERYTPESIGSKERRDIRELAEMNKVKLSTHASTSIQGLAGLGREGFSDEQRQQTLKEIQKAIDFASDLQGGAVVFHTGEWPRPFSESKWNKDKMFVNYPEEEKQAVLHLVDDRTGNVIQSVRKSQIIHEPVYEEDGNGNWVTIDGDTIDKNIDITDPANTELLLKRKPKWDPDKEQFETRPVNWQMIEQRAKERGVKPEKEFYFTQLEEQLLRARGQSLFYSRGYEDYVERLKAVNEALEFYEKLEDSMPEDEKWKIMKQKNIISRPDLVPPKDQLPSEYLKEVKRDTERSLKHTHEASAAADVQAKNAAEQLNHVKPIAEFGIEKSSDTIARAAEYAYEKTRQKNPDRPIYVSPESFMPNMYGGHPDEIHELIDSSRDAFIKRMEKKVGKEKAQQLAKEHIKGTLDVGHFNMWKQHFQGSDKEFKKWYLNKVEGLVKSGKIGQVHITDNLGFDDEHLSPGEGNVPIKEVMKMVEKEGIKDIIVEAGSFNPVDIVPDTFSYFGSPVYNVARGPSFQQFHNQHFGYNAPPFYVVGAYAPSNEWSLWSDVPLE